MIKLIDTQNNLKLTELLTDKSVSLLKEHLKNWKKIVIFLNSRGEHRWLICDKCSHIPKCEDCDAIFNVHKYPVKQLICHHCSRIEIIPMLCKKCKSPKLKVFGAWTQNLEDNIFKYFKDYSIQRIDSDIKNKTDHNADILITTFDTRNFYKEHIDVAFFPSIESMLMIPQYDIEEIIYSFVKNIIDRSDDIIIQSWNIESDFMDFLVNKSFQEFIKHTINNRKLFWYPPYKDLAYIWVYSHNKTKVDSLINHLVNKLNLIVDNKISNKYQDYNIFYDKEIYKKLAWKFWKKIVLQWSNLKEFFREHLSTEILKNREITIEWR